MLKRMCALAGMAVAVATLLVASANAAVNIRIEGPTVSIGDITLRIYATADAGETDNTIFGAINFPDALVNTNVAGNSQTPLFSSQGALTCTTAFCVAFSQVNPAGPIALNLTDTLIATTTFHVDPGNPPGTVINFRGVRRRRRSGSIGSGSPTRPATPSRLPRSPNRRPPRCSARACSGSLSPFAAAPNPLHLRRAV